MFFKHPPVSADHQKNAFDLLILVYLILVVVNIFARIGTKLLICSALEFFTAFQAYRTVCVC
jgi:hypothetical protein